MPAGVVAAVIMAVIVEVIVAVIVAVVVAVGVVGAVGVVVADPPRRRELVAHLAPVARFARGPMVRVEVVA